MKSPRNSHPPGFSLVEMLVVIAVIGILAAIAVPNIGRVNEAANESKDQRNAQTLASVCEAAQAAGLEFVSGPDLHATVRNVVTGSSVSDQSSPYYGNYFGVPLNEVEEDKAKAYLALEHGKLVYTPAKHTVPASSNPVESSPGEIAETPLYSDEAYAKLAEVTGIPVEKLAQYSGEEIAKLAEEIQTKLQARETAALAEATGIPADELAKYSSDELAKLKEKVTEITELAEATGIPAEKLAQYSDEELAEVKAKVAAKQRGEITAKLSEVTGIPTEELDKYSDEELAKLQSAYEEKLAESSSELPRTQGRLSTGRRINPARDDAAGLEVSESVIRDADLAEENAQLQAVLELLR